MTVRRRLRPADPLPFWLAVLGVPVLVVALLGTASALHWHGLVDAWIAVVVLGPLIVTALIGRIARLSLQRTVTLMGYAVVMTFVLAGICVALLYVAFVIACDSGDSPCLS